jgi:hypothetical protein
MSHFQDTWSKQWFNGSTAVPMFPVRCKLPQQVVSFRYLWVSGAVTLTRLIMRDVNAQSPIRTILKHKIQYKPGSITMHCYFCAPFYITLLYKVTQKLLNQECLSFNRLTGQCCPIKCTTFTSERKKHRPTYTNAHKKHL